MKLFAPPAIVRLLSVFAVVHLLSISAPTTAATVPTEWTVRIGPRSASYQAERRHGDALDLRATLTYNGQPLVYTGPARLYAQTNGMGSAWWDLAPCTVVSNTLQATWLPAFDTGADVVDLFLGGPSNYQAAARIRFLPSPGSVPNSLPLPAPTLDFATVQILNPPYYTRQETDSAIESAAPGDYSTVSNRAMSAIQEHQSLEPSTNYTDRTLGAFAATGTVHAAESSTYSSRLFDASYDSAYDATYLIRESTNAATAVSSSLVRYALVTPGEWEFSGVPSGATNITFVWYSSRMAWELEFTIGGSVYTMEGTGIGGDSALNVTCVDENYTVTATRASLPGHLCDRSVNAVSLSSPTNITLPALSHPGQARDFILLLDIPASITNTVPAITNLLTFTASGTETVHYYVDGDDPSTATFPLPTSPGTWSYSFSEFKASWFAVSLKPIVEVSAPGGAQ